MNFDKLKNNSRNILKSIGLIILALAIYNVVSDIVVGFGYSFFVKMLDKDDPIQYGMMWGSGALVGQKEQNVVFKVMSPEIGVPFVTEQTMILNTSKKQALAKEFIDWFGQTEIQVEYSKNFGSIPANTEAVKELPEATKKFVDQVKPQSIDWEAVGKHLDEWVEKAELEYVK